LEKSEAKVLNINFSFIPHSVPHTLIIGLNRICRHNIEYGYNNTYTGTSNGILAKHGLWLPDDGLFKPKHVGVAFVILIVLII
jgi:hypothetical protein